MIHKLVSKNDPILKQKMPKFDFVNPTMDPIQLAKDLAETMLAKNGMGLSAPQIGIEARAFVIKSNPVIAVFNPLIVDVSSEMISLEEGCLTFPGYYVKVKRPSAIKVRFTRPNGEVVTEKFAGLTARIFMHEMDHLDGVLFMQRANLFHRDQAKKRAGLSK